MNYRVMQLQSYDITFPQIITSKVQRVFFIVTLYVLLSSQLKPVYFLSSIRDSFKILKLHLDFLTFQTSCSLAGFLEGTGQETVVYTTQAFRGVHY